MPACFQLYDKSKPGEGPVILQTVDEDLCAHFGVPVDPTKWMGDWYGTIGFRLAMGWSFEKIREAFGEHAEEARRANHLDHAGFYENASSIATYLEKRYTTDSFYSPFK